MTDLFEKVELFYSLATTGNRKSLFNKLANPVLVVTPELSVAVKDLASKLEPQFLEEFKQAMVTQDLRDLKTHIHSLAAATANANGKVYTDAVTVLTQVNREIRNQTEKK